MNYLSKLKKIVFAFTVLFSFGYFANVAFAASDDVIVIVNPGYTITTAVSGYGSISPSSTTVSSGGSATFTLTPNTGSYIGGASGCGGTLSGSTYTTGTITSNCEITAYFYRNAWVIPVYMNGYGSGSVSPTSATVYYGDTTSFSISPNSGSYVSSVTGCNGSLSGSTYTTGAIVDGCAVYVTFSLNTATVSTSVTGNGTVSPTSRSVSLGSSTSFTVTPNTGYYVSSASGCGGYISGTTYYTGNITGDCTVYIEFSIIQYTVSVSVSGSGTVSPASRTVSHGSSTTFTVTPGTGYYVSSASGCSGTLSGNTYTTGAITANCTVSVVFSRYSYTVTGYSDTGGTITPSSRTVYYGDTTTFTLGASTGYAVGSVYAPNCSGSLSGSTYTTGAVYQDCTVTHYPTLIMSGTLSSSASSCTISIDGSSCSVNLTWTTSDPIGTSSITASGMTSVSGNSGTNVAFTVPYNTRTFYLYNSGYQLAYKTVTSSCATGSTWNSSQGKCARNSYTVSTSAGTGGSISPTSASVAYGSTTSFTVTPNTGYSISSVTGCGGTRSGNTYTTGAITAACTVTATFSLNSYTVSTSNSGCTTVNPTSATVNHGSTTSFAITPGTGRYISSTSGCSGSLSGTTYTTGAITAACTVSMSCPLYTYTVSTSAGTGGTISAAQTINYGSTASITVTPNTGYSISSVTGCSGTLSGNTYTTGAITANCTVSATFVINSYTVSTSAGTGGSISPTSASVAYGSTTSFTVTPNTGYSISSVTGCGGTRSGNTYTTGAITAACTVSATFSINSYTVSTSNSACTTVSPTSVAVNYGSTTAISITPGTGRYISSASGCGGSLSGGTFTTGGITANCTVSMSCPLYTYTVSSSAGAGGTISGAQTISYGSTAAFTVTPSTGYQISSVSGCGGSLSGNTFTTGAITGACTVSAVFSDGTAPTAPGAVTASWTRDHWVNGAFVASTSGSSDAGTGIRGYRLCRSNDNSSGCYTWTAAGEHASTSETVSGADLPSPGTYRYYYWYAYDNAGNQSTNSSGEYIRMDGASPVYNSTSFTGCNYESGDNCYVKNGTTFYVFVSHSDGQSGTNTQYFELSKDGANRGTWDGATGNIKSYAVPYAVGYGAYYTSYGEGMVNDSYMNIVDAQCVQSGNCDSTALGKWKVVAGSGASTMYGVTVYMYDGMWNGVGYTATPKYVYLDNTAPSVPTPTDAGANQASATLTFNSDPSDAYSGVSTCYAQVDVNNTDGASLAMDTTDVGADGDHTFSGSAGNTYYYRYYCTDKVGNSSGWSSWTDGISINVAPTVTTPAHTSVSLTSATLGATVTSAGVPASLTARGTCWGTSAAPTTNCAAEGGTTVSSFSHSRTGLTPSTTYYYRGYATNSTGTSYSADNTFTTSAVTVSAVNATTSYNATVGSSVSFAYTMPTTNISTTECQLLDNASVALTSYATTNPIVYTAPSTPGAFGYYIRCRNATYTGTTSTSNLITVNIASPTGSISASPTACSIPVDGSSCSTTISWSTTNPVNTSTVVSGGTTLYTANSGSQSVSVPYSSRTFTLNNNGAQIGTVTPTSSCVTGSTWNSTSGTCVINTYTVSATAGTGGSISPTSTVVNYGSTTSFTITPSTGYSISSASGCGGTRSGNTYTTGAITANCTVSIAFTINTYTVSTSIGSNGTVSPSSRSVNHGSTTTFNIVPNAGYSISASGCGGSLSGTRYTTGAITSACAVSISFSKLSYTLSYSAGVGGTISGTSSQTVNYGSDATTVTAVPNTGYHFTGWSDNCGNATGGSISTLSNGDKVHTFTSGGTFTPANNCSPEVLVVAGGGGSGGGGNTGWYSGGGGGGGLIYNPSYSINAQSYSVTVGSGGSAGLQSGDTGSSGGKGGDSVFNTLTAIGGGYGGGNPGGPARGGNGGSGGGGALYNNTGGSGTSGQGNSGGSVQGQCGGAGGGAGSYGGDCLGVAYVSGYGGDAGSGLPYSISGNFKYYAGGGAGAGQTTNGYGDPAVGSTATSTAGAANTGSGGGGVVSQGGRTGGSGVVIIRYPAETSDRQDTSVTSNKNVTASFAINTYTVSATAGTGGTISPASTPVNHGSTTSFTLTPNTGYHINTVSGCGGTRSGNTYTTAAIAGDCTVSATFAIDTFNLLVYKTGTGTGTVTSNPAGINCGSTCSAAYDLGTSVTLTATPDIDGNIFAGWSGACTGTSTCTVTMSAVKSVTATFNAVTISVTPTATTYYVARGANNTFGFTPTTSTGTAECRLLNSTSTALTNYATGTSITYAIPSTAGAYGYYIQCRNVSYPTKIATSSLITVNAVSVSVSATTSYNTTPGASVSFAYTPSTTAGTTECALLNNTQTAITSYQAASPIVYAIPNNVGTYGYYVRCRHTIATTETATSSAITVTSACATGTSWNGSSCVAPTGTLTSSNCSISAGNSTCQTSLNWSTSNPIGTSAVTTNYPTSGTTVSSQNSGTNVAYTIPYGSTTFYLYNNAIPLSQSTATASCASGTVWNTQDGKCQATTGTINATGCPIYAGSSSCSSAITWSTLNPYEATSTVKTSGGATVSTGLSGSVNYSVNPGTHTFNLWHYGSIIANATATVVCSSLSEWNGSICELKAPEIMTFTASQSNVVRGRPTTLVWESEPDATCTGTNFETGGLYAGTVSVNPTVDTTYTLSCVRGTKTTTKSITIKMLDISIIEQ